MTEVSWRMRKRENIKRDLYCTLYVRIPFRYDVIFLIVTKLFTYSLSGSHTVHFLEVGRIFLSHFLALIHIKFMCIIYSCIPHTNLIISTWFQCSFYLWNLLKTEMKRIPCKWMEAILNIRMIVREVRFVTVILYMIFENLFSQLVNKFEQ